MTKRKIKEYVQLSQHAHGVWLLYQEAKLKIPQKMAAYEIILKILLFYYNIL
jgi:hypothetical protein